MKICLVCDGSRNVERAAEYLKLLHFPGSSHIYLFASGKLFHQQDRLRIQLESLKNILKTDYSNVTDLVEQGQIIERLLSSDEEINFDLICYGESYPVGPLKRIRSERSISTKLARKLIKPFLIVRNLPKITIEYVLICTSLDPSVFPKLELVGELLTGLNTDVRLLHVMSQVALTIQSPSDDLIDTAESAITRGTMEGKKLQNAVDLLSKAGTFRKITPRLRHGLVLDEVHSEILEQTTDLLVIGSHRRSRKWRFINYLTEDVSLDLIYETPCSILIV